MIKTIAKPIVHAVTGTRKFYYQKLVSVAKDSAGKHVLEIGSGKQVNGKEAYSVKHLFKGAKEFRQTDINPDFGHEVLDITDMSISNKYDVILCLNVLEHVYDTDTAIANLRKALKKDGTLYIAVPFMFPLHDEPHDYWRFTEHALRRILSDFSDVKVSIKGSKKLPYGHFVAAKK